MKHSSLIVAVAAGLVVLGGGVAYAQTRGDSGSYRTATAVRGDVDRTLNLSGTVTASTRRNLSFGVAGTLKKVSVQAGDPVRSGAVLAELDPTDLTRAVTQAKAAVAKAEAQLESAQTSQSTTVATATTLSSTSKSSATGSKSASTGSNAAANPALQKALLALRQQQTAVTSAQTAATAAISASTSALNSQLAACTTDAASTDPITTDCTAALDTVQSAQGTVADKQDILQTALEALSKTVSGAASMISQPAKGTPTKTGSGGSSAAGSSAKETTPSQDNTGRNAGTSPGSGGAVSAGSIAQDQATIDTAKANLTEAERSAAAAKLTAPFAGRVLSISVTKGGSVGASDAVMVFVGNGNSTVTTTVTAAQINSVKRGQKASITPVGADKAVAATVTSVGLLPNSSATYPVTLEIDGTVAAPEGSTAVILLVTGTAKSVLTVPSSAVSTAGRATVAVLSGGTQVRTPVTVGIVGQTRTSITAGLKPGQLVVLADLKAQLPAAGTANGFGGGSGGGFGRVPRNPGGGAGRAD